MKVFKEIFDSLIIAGTIILLIGLYYWIIKAGLPYLDAPTELQIQYAINLGIGETLVKTGICVTALGSVCRIVFGVIGKKKK